MPIGITITEKSVNTTASSTGRISRLTLLISPSGADASLLNELIAVTSATELKQKYPTVSEIVEETVKMVFLNNAQANLLVFACSDSATADQTAIKAHITKGVELLGKKDLELSFVSCPELYSVSLQADRTSIYSAIQSFCDKSDWLFFANTAATTDTKTKAVTERDLYSSPLGHSALFYGAIVTNNNITIPIATIAATIAIKRDQSEAYAPPAGAKYPLLGVKSLTNYTESETDYNDLKAKQINVLQKIPKYGVCIWGAQTLSVDTRFQLINTRVAVSVVSERLKSALIPLLFQASDPQGRTNREVDRVIISQMTEVWLEGGLSGDTPEDAFKIIDLFVPETEPQTTPATPTDPANPAPTPTTNTIPRSVRRVKKQVYARFVEYVEMIEVGLFVVDTLP